VRREEGLERLERDVVDDAIVEGGAEEVVDQP
jgi:hypothetical protein